MKTILFLFVSGMAGAQQLDLSSLDKLAAQARESTNVSLDESKLKLAAQFLSKDEPGSEKAISVLNGMKGVYVRSFEFDKGAKYPDSALEPIRKQLRGPGWSNIVSVRERDETSEIYFYGAGNTLGGIAVIAAEPNELTVVNIVGPVDINALSKLSGTLKIPNIHINMLGGAGKPAPGAPPKKDE